MCLLHGLTICTSTGLAGGMFLVRPSALNFGNQTSPVSERSVIMADAVALAIQTRPLRFQEKQLSLEGLGSYTDYHARNCFCYNIDGSQPGRGQGPRIQSKSARASECSRVCSWPYLFCPIIRLDWSPHRLVADKRPNKQQRSVSIRMQCHHAAAQVSSAKHWPRRLSFSL